MLVAGMRMSDVQRLILYAFPTENEWANTF